MENFILLFVPMSSLGNAKTINNIFLICKMHRGSKISCKSMPKMVSSVLRYCITS